MAGYLEGKRVRVIEVDVVNFEITPIMEGIVLSQVIRDDRDWNLWICVLDDNDFCQYFDVKEGKIRLEILEPNPPKPVMCESSTHGLRELKPDLSVDAFGMGVRK